MVRSFENDGVPHASKMGSNAIKNRDESGSNSVVVV
jgi:hypothetical protein